MLSVREIEAGDIPYLMDYWYSADENYLRAMGADISKLPERTEWSELMQQQIELPYALKQSYCIIWLMGNKPVGHCNVNKIVYGKEAYMHLHLWDRELRQKGTGHNMIKLALPFFFDNLQLETLHCEPYSLNPAPNKTLPKAGFRFVKSYTCIPGSLNFEQEVNLWALSRNEYKALRPEQPF